jgi:F0F1-type ATP synthase membrane subunit b/b'
MEATNNEKQALEASFKKRKEDYKKEAEARTSTEVEELREKLNIKMKADLSKQADAAKKFLEDLDYDYEQNHEKIANDIFQSLIEV